MLFRQGDRVAFRFFYDMYSSGVYRFCRHIVGDEAIAQDAFQETFIKVYEHRSELRGENIKGWLFTIARRVSLNQLRAKRAQHEAYDEALHSVEHASESDVLLKEELEKAIARLPVPFREALVLREYEGYSYQEISTILGIDLSLAKVRVHRARLLLRKELTEVFAAQR
jgi:RNA polymerase sigma-70 factor, ECF subfamily